MCVQALRGRECTVPSTTEDSCRELATVRRMLSVPGVGSRMFGSTTGRTWSTNGVPEGEQFSFWREVVAQAFVPVSLVRTRPAGAFASSATARRVGPVGVSRIVSAGQSVARTPSQIAGGAGDVFFLNLPLCDGSFAVQDGRSACLGSGDFAIVDSSRPFELRFERDFEQFSLTLPHDLLAPLLASARDATAVRVCGSSGVGMVAAAAIRAFALAEGSFDRCTARSLTGQLAGLIALALGGVQAPPRSASRALVLRAALDEVERSLYDSELSPAQVSGRVGISTSYLHKLFADRGLSFGRWVLTRRLERCHRDLTDAAWGHCTVAQIACRHGLKDPSYFARAFKTHYGITPRQLRCGRAPPEQAARR